MSWNPRGVPLRGPPGPRFPLRGRRWLGVESSENKTPGNNDFPTGLRIPKH